MRNAPGIRERTRASWLAVLAIGALLIGGGALAAAKQVSGSPGPDKINGTAGPDVLRGGRGEDVIKGRGGPDRLIGGKHGDRLIGGPGSDEINMRAGAQIASPGNDLIKARDGTPDQINCGDGGGDIAKVDAVEEGVYDCEIIRDPKVEGENID